MNFNSQELLAVVIARLPGDAGHVAEGAASPNLAAAPLCWLMFS